jgi:hypothetical protein
MYKKTNCDGCGKSVNFDKEAAGGCFTHKKDYCWECTQKHICIAGEHCNRFFISNPKWICNLRKVIDGDNI